MDKKRLFKKYYRRLLWEGLIKAVICSLIVGFGASIVPAYIAASRNNFNDSNAIGFWIALAMGVAVMLLLIPLFYFVFFRPKTKNMVARIDRLGMDQRLITMLELEKDESYMAMLQREDAKARLRSIKARSLKFSVFVLPVVILALMTFCSTAMVAVTVTEFDGRLPWATVGQREAAEPEAEVEDIPEPEEQPDAEVTYYKITFQVFMGAGYFSGDTFQVVQRGDNTTTVTAVPRAGYGFDCWEMGAFSEEDPQHRNPQLTLKNVQQDHLFWAKFVPLSDDEEEGEQQVKVEKPDEESDPADPNNILDNENRYDSEEHWEKYSKEELERLMDEDIPDDLREMLEYYWSHLKP